MSPDERSDQTQVSNSSPGIVQRLFGWMRKDMHYHQNYGVVQGDVQNAQNITNNINYSNDIPDTLPEPTKILPYLANRESQAFALEQFTASHLEKNGNRVIVCVIPGAINELPTGFKLRCNQVLLAELLLLYGIDMSIIEWVLQWPSDKLDADAGMARLTSELCKKLKLKLNADEQEIIQAIGALNTSVSLWCSINPKQWDKSAQSLMQKWIDYWLDLPKSDNDNFIFVLVGLYYDEKGKNLKGETADDSARTKSMKAFVDKLKQDNRPNLICLDELESLCGNDLDNWASSVCPDVIQNIDEGLLDEARLQSRALELCSNDEYKPLKELLDGMRDALKYACSNR